MFTTLLKNVHNFDQIFEFWQSYIIIKRNKIFIFPSDDMIRSTQEVVVQMAISVGEPLFQKPMSSLQLIV